MLLLQLEANISNKVFQAIAYFVMLILTLFYSVFLVLLLLGGGADLPPP